MDFESIDGLFSADDGLGKKQPLGNPFLLKKKNKLQTKDWKQEMNGIRMDYVETPSKRNFLIWNRTVICLMHENKYYMIEYKML